MTEHSSLRYFPYDRPYDHQQEAMGRIADALDAGSDILFEGATGTGKTLAALTPALEYARSADKTVVITTNVHQQMRQFRREASAIADTEHIRAVVFRGKGSMCHIDVGYRECQALRDTTHELVETQRDLAELEQRQRELLEQSREGTPDALEGRRSVMDELDAVEADLAAFDGRATCDYFHHNLTTSTEAFFSWLYDDVRSPDEIYRFAEEQGFCGYELLKDGVDGVDLVVCNYHHLLDATIREQFFHWLGREPADVVAIFDEAHNVESAARDHARRTLTELTLARALDELEGVSDARTTAANNVISAFHDGLRAAYGEAFDFGERERVGQEWYDLTIDNDDRRDDLTLGFLDSYTGPGYHADLESALDLGRELDRTYEREFKDGTRSVRTDCPTLQSAQFVEAWLEHSDSTGTYPVVSVRRRDGASPGGSGSSGGSSATNPERPGTGSSSTGPSGNDPGTNQRTPHGDAVYGRAELFTCLPDRVTKPLFDDLHASVLMSATLRPFAVTEAVLGLDSPETMVYGQQFPADRRRTYAVDGPALFASKRDDPGVRETVTTTLEDVVRFTPGNVLLFFPSYAEARRYHDRVSRGSTYLDEPGVAAHDLREEFASDDDGVMFTSLWGTLGEGVSFDGDDARTVVVVGVPYPHLDDRLEAVRETYDAVFANPQSRHGTVSSDRRSDEDVGWQYAVEVPTIRKTRQALGRVIRSPDDFGVRVLLDARYTERASVEMPDYAVRGSFPPEERAELVDVDPDKLKFGLLNFYTDVDAWDGEPPEPN